jgi:hypothetical protein
VDSERTPVVSAYFSILGEAIDFEKISTLLGAEPTEAGIAGEVLPGKRRPCKETFWERRSTARQHSIDSVIGEVLSVFWEHRENLLDYVQECDATIEVLCTVDLYADGAGYSISRESIEKLAYFHAGFDLDISDFR